VTPLSEGGASLVAVTGLRTHGDVTNAQADSTAAQKALARQAEGEVVAHMDEVRRTPEVL
jgi:hypothetical protein